MSLERFVDGYRKFEREVFPQHAKTFESLAGGQQPPMLLVTCSDSRIVPDLVLQAGPGELFVLRNAGNIIPPYGPHPGAEAAAIEYGVNVLKVGHLVVCGHSRCGAMQAVLNPEPLESLPAVKSWVGFSEAARSAVEGGPGETSLDALIERNVLLQLDHLRTHPSVARAMAAGTLEIHGWVYRFETGTLLAHDAASDSFRKLGG